MYTLWRTDVYQVEAGRGLAFVDHQAAIALAGGRPFEDLVIGFRLQFSNWPLRASFPMFVLNVLERLRELEARAAGAMARPGETLPIEPGPAAKISVRTPDGREVLLPATPGSTAWFHQTERVGVYEVRAGSRRTRFAVNLLSPAESDTTPRARLDLGGRQVETASEVQSTPQPLWRWFALAALVVCLLEWWVFHRKIE